MIAKFRAQSNVMAQRASLLFRQFHRNTKGATAIEFAIVLVPFLAFTFGIITIGLHYLATNSLEKGVFDASRQIRTGQAQKANMTSENFKALVCNLARPNINCDKLRIHMASYDSWSQVATPNCVDGATGNLTTGSSATSTVKELAGGASRKVLVTVCYDWTLAKYLPFLLRDFSGNPRYSQQLGSGGLLLQSAVVFQTEPYE